MSKAAALWKQTSHYLAGRVALMALGLVSFPFLTRLLSVGQYGELSLLLKLALFWTVLSKAGLQNATLRMLPEHAREGRQAASACASTLLVESCALAALCSLLAFSLLRVFAARLSPSIVLLAPIVLALVWVRSVQPVVAGILRSEGRSILFNICELLGRSCGIGFSLAALTLFSRQLSHYLVALLAAEGLVLIALLVWLRRRGFLDLASVDRGLARRALVFSAPLIAYELASVLLDSGDRILIARYLNLTQLGLYSAAYSIATYTEEALMTPVNMALFPAYMKVWVEEGAAATARFLSRSFDAFFAMACAVLMGSLLCSHDAIVLLASSKFAAAAHLLPILVAGLLIYALHIFFNAPLIIYRKSIALSAVTVVSLLLNIVLNVILIPRIGIMGSAIATLISYLALVVSLAVVSRRYLPFPIPSWNLLLSMAAAALSYAAVRHLHAPWTIGDLLLKAVVSVILFAAILCATRRDLQQKLRDTLARLRGRNHAHRDIHLVAHQQAAERPLKAAGKATFAP